MSSNWRFLRAISVLCGQTSAMAPLTMEQARAWKDKICVLADEVIPSESGKIYSLSAMATLMLMKRFCKMST
eukprot:751401-Hanusia_phi.AAC.1